MAKQESTIEVGGRQIKLSNLEKILYPKVGFTKGQVADYFMRVAPVLLPHLAGRPLTLKRYPEGVEGMFFYEKNCPKYRPDWVKTAKVWSESNHRFMFYCVVDELPTLIWLANLADLELHTSLATAPDIHRPTVIAFDLDPGPPANIVQCCQVGLWVRDIFEQFGLQAFPKTSGSKGLQIYVPLNTPVTYDQTKAFAKGVARLLEDRCPDQVISDMKKALRTNKVFVDWSQNDDHKTTICVYSLRARERPTVSTPVTWKEVESCLKKADPDLLVFTSDDVLARVEKLGDLFEPVLRLKQNLPPVESLEQLAEDRNPDTKKPKTTKVRSISSVAKSRKPTSSGPERAKNQVRARRHTPR